MKNRILLISLVLSLIGFIGYGFAYQSPEPDKQDNENNQTNTWITAAVNTFNDANDEDKNEQLYYSVMGRYTIPVKRENLENVHLISDLVPNYPNNSISAYHSVEITTTNNNQIVTAVSPNEVLSQEQLKLIHAADRAAEILVKVSYKAESPIDRQIEERQLEASLTIIPDIEAEYKGGYEKMIKYLKDNSYPQIYGLEKWESPGETINGCKVCQRATIFFTVNEKGKTENFEVIESCDNPGSDKFLIELINNMPNWEPAKNKDGTPVKQDFKFVIGPDGC